MAESKKIYWDSCIWISIIRDEEGRAPICKHLLDLAKKGEVQIWTSSLTLAEVFKKKCNAETVAIDAASDHDFDSFIEQDFIVEVQLDHDIGVMARSLLRQHPELKKPADAIHLASAVLHNVDELHTFDHPNLLVLDGKVNRKDGQPLRIVAPTMPEPPKIEESPQMSLLPEGVQDSKDPEVVVEGSAEDAEITQQEIAAAASQSAGSFGDGGATADVEHAPEDPPETPA